MEPLVLAVQRYLDALDRKLPRAVEYERKEQLRQALTYYHAAKAQEEIELAFPIAAE